MTTNTQPENASEGRERRVLVVGTDSWAIEQASATLSAAGFTVVNCIPPGEPTFPCNALVEGRECPLVEGFAVVVTVRARPVDVPTPGEMGVICGLRVGAALVTAGMNWRSPFAPWAASSVSDENDLAA